MRERGFTVTELIIVIAIIGILVAMGTYSFSTMSRKSGMEKQIKMMYVDLMTARAQALYTRTPKGVKISATNFSVWSSATTHTPLPILNTNLRYPVTLNTVSTKLVFDPSGVSFTGFSSVCLGGDNKLIADSIVITSTRVQLGKRDPGGPCGVATIRPVEVK